MKKTSSTILVLLNLLFPSLLGADPLTIGGLSLASGLSLELGIIGEGLAGRGGYGEGTAALGLVSLGLEVDLEEVWGWQRTRAHASALWIQGGEPSESLVGDFNGVSNIAGYNSLRTFQAWIEHESLSKAWNLRAGWLALDEEFMVAETAGLFQNAAFGPLPLVSGTFKAPIWPLAAPGIRLQWALHERLVVRGGAYDGATREEEENPIRPETELDSDDAGFYLLEADWRLSEDQGLKLGAYYHGGQHENFETGRKDRNHPGIYGVLSGGLPLLADDGWRYFLRAGISLSEASSISTDYYDLGLVWTAPFPGRPRDELGLAFSRTRFGDAYLEAQRIAGERATRYETTLELTYLFEITESFALQPDLQWIRDPHFSGQDAIVAGLRIVTSMDRK